MARTHLGLRPGLAALAAFALGCGLVHKDVDVSKDFTAGGGPPTADARVDGNELVAPLSASAGDLSHLSAVTLRAARLEATDQGNLAFISDATIVITASGLPQATLATLPAVPAGSRADLTVDSSKDLKPYLQAGALLDATITWPQRPVTARGLRLTLTIRGGL